MDPALFGIVIVTVDGDVYEVGNSKDFFAIQSISKPFVYGMALEQHGDREVLEKIGVEATGMPFNSILAVQLNPTHKQNPSVNAGAIATVSLIKGKSSEEKFDSIVQMFSKYLGRTPKLDPFVLESERATSSTNHALAALMKSLGLLYADVHESLDIYLKDCSLLVNAYDLAVMGATLANGGIQPLTKQRAIEQKHIRDLLSVMLISGLYDYSGRWLFNVGIPAKSGVGGGILCVVPGKFGIGIFSPPLDDNGNSVRGIKTAAFLSQKLHLHLLGTVQL